jgi:hypothetical protein
MSAKTNAQRQAELKARRLAAGLVAVRVWAHQADTPAIKALADDLRARRIAQTLPVR